MALYMAEGRYVQGAATYGPTLPLPIIQRQRITEKISDQEVGSKETVEKTLDYISRQVGRLRIIHELPLRSHSVVSEALANRSLDVKTAAFNYISIHWAHECTRLGIAGTTCCRFGSS